MGDQRIPESLSTTHGNNSKATNAVIDEKGRHNNQEN